MIQFIVKSEFINSFLKSCSGEIEIENFEFDVMKFIKIFACKWSINNNKNMNFKSINKHELYSYDIFKKYEEEITLILKSYHGGMCLKDNISLWIKGNIMKEIQFEPVDKQEKMIRIDITWKHINPFLKVCSGIIEFVEMEDNSIYGKGINYKSILICKVKKEDGVLSFSNITKKNYNQDVFKKYKHQIKLIVSSYFNGMCLKENGSYWMSE